MADLPGLKRQRAINKGKLTNIARFIREAGDEVSIEAVKVRLVRVEKLMDEFTSIENQIALISETEPVDTVYEENYYNAVTGLNILLRNLTLGLANDNVADVSLNATQAGAHSEVKLPKIHIPTFSGNYSEWHSFFDLFTSTIHESNALNAVQKFQYLKSLLRGEAETLLRHMSVTEGNYIGALNKLKERYDRKKHIINSHIRTFIEQPPISHSSAANIRKLMDTSDEAIRGLRALGENVESRVPSINGLFTFCGISWMKNPRPCGLTIAVQKKNIQNLLNFRNFQLVALIPRRSQPPQNE